MTVGQYLARLAAEATTIINAQDYGRTIYELALRRDLIRIGEDMVNVAFDAPVDFAPRAQIEDAERQLYELAEIRPLRRRVPAFLRRPSPSPSTWRPTPFSATASCRASPPACAISTSRWAACSPPILIIVAGRPGMGKTALATNIAYNVAKAHRAEVQADGTMKSVNGGIVGFFSCEMSAEQLATRILAEQTSIASSTIRRGGISEADFEKIRDYSIELQSLPLYVDETGGLSISQLTARARRLKRQKGLDLIVVDYIQLLQGSGKRSDNRVQEVTEITTSLKALAKELNVPIIALSQLSRQVESRDDKRPQLSDLRESGSIEQDADVVMFVFREEYYLANKEPRIGTPEYEKWQLDMSLVHGKAEVIIGKQRHGPTGTVELAVRGPVHPVQRSGAGRPSAGADVLTSSSGIACPVEPSGAARVKARHEHRLRPEIDPDRPLLSAEANQAAALAAPRPACSRSISTPSSPTGASSRRPRCRPNAPP